MYSSCFPINQFSLFRPISYAFSAISSLFIFSFFKVEIVFTRFTARLLDAPKPEPGATSLFIIKFAPCWKSRDFTTVTANSVPCSGFSSLYFVGLKCT